MKKNIFFYKIISSFLLAAFLLPSSVYAGLGNASPPSAETFLKKLKEDQVLVIESFTKQGKNLFGHPSQLISPEKAKVWESYGHNDAVYKQGKNLDLSFWIPGDKEIAWKTELDPLDISQAQFLVFWYQGTIGTKGSLWLALSDIHGRRKEVSIFPYVGPPSKTKSKWRPVVVPVEAFDGVDFNYLSEMEVIIRSGFFGLIGKISIDHISFVGPRNIIFNSVKDNVKGIPSLFPGKLRRKDLYLMDEKEMLLEIAKDTWGYFDNLIDTRNDLILDHIKLGKGLFLGDYTSPTNIGMYMIACVSAYHLGFISRKSAIDRIKKTLKAIERLPQHEHFFYNFYNTTHLHPTNNFISSIDNAWLASALVVVRSAFKKELYKEATARLDKMNFDFFYDPGVEQMGLGYDVKENEHSLYHYSLLSTETRILSLLAIGKGDVPSNHWFRLHRIPPSSWDWQTQKPKEKDVSVEGDDFRTGFYKYNNRRFVPSWGGSLFEFLMPTLLVPEKEWSPYALGINDKIVSELHRDYALKERKYPVWGISPCSVSRGKSAIYDEFGIKALGIKGYNDAGIITPHVSFLALETIPKDAISNLKRMLQLYDVYGEYGFYDSIQVRGKIVTYHYLALDQGMSLIALTNYLNNGSIQQLFARDPVGKKIKDLLKDEEFF